MYEVGDIVNIVKKGILYYQAGKIKQINEDAELKYKVETEKKCIAYLGEKGENCFYTFEANYNHKNELLDSIDFEYDDIGKIIFLTREEAERALKDRSGEFWKV